MSISISEFPPPMTNPEPEASTSKTSILRKPLPIGERLARLAGYTLIPGDHTQSRKQITFHPKVRRLDWRGWIEEDIKEEAQSLVNSAVDPLMSVLGVKGKASRIVLQKVPSEANPKVRNHGEGPY